MKIVNRLGELTYAYTLGPDISFYGTVILSQPSSITHNFSPREGDYLNIIVRETSKIMTGLGASYICSFHLRSMSLVCVHTLYQLYCLCSFRPRSIQNKLLSVMPIPLRFARITGELQVIWAGADHYIVKLFPLRSPRFL